MRKKEIFFVGIFTICFCMCAVWMHKVSGSHEGGPTENVQSTETSEVLVADRQEQETGQETEQETGQEVPRDQEIGFEEGMISSEKETETEEIRYFVQADSDYFTDALFIGDSRAVGLMEYGNIVGADFFAHSGMSVFGIDKKKIEIAGLGKVDFGELLNGKQYGKIYLMLGMNGLGYRFDELCKRYVQTVERIRAKQKDAIIFLCANMHVTKKQSEQDAIYNNDNINKINNTIAGLEDQKQLFYIDVNELFDDENGNLDERYTIDAFHVLGKYYTQWADWLCTKAVIKDTKNKDMG